MSKIDPLVKLQIEERSDNFRVSWRVYISFYSGFIAMNMIAFGFALSIPKDDRFFFSMLFVFQNFLALGTAIQMAKYSRDSEGDLKRLLRLCEPEPADKILVDSPLPNKPAIYGARANAAGHIVLIILWLFVLILPQVRFL